MVLSCQNWLYKCTERVLWLALKVHSCVINCWLLRKKLQKLSIICTFCINSILSSCWWSDDKTNNELDPLTAPQWWEARAPDQSLHQTKYIYHYLSFIIIISGPSKENIYYFIHHLACSSCLLLPQCYLVLGRQLTGQRNGNTLKLLNFLSQLCK